MAKPKVVVFDLFETLIHEVKFDFNLGLAYIQENILSKDTDKVEFLNYAGTYWKEIYDKRNEDNSEVAFDDEVLDFKNKYGFKEDIALEEIILNCVLKIDSTELFDDTIFTLEQLRALGIPIYLLSNSIFKKNVMTKFINQYDLEKYFVNIHFSADYKLRKPHKDLFQVVFDDIKKYDDGIEKKQVYFVGDNFKADVLGAEGFGFIPVFINRNKDTKVNDKGFLEIEALSELLEIIK